jgi:hypothetical protein
MINKGRTKQKFGRYFNKKKRMHRSWDLFSYMAKEITQDLKYFKKYNVNSVPGELHLEICKNHGFEEGSMTDEQYKIIDEECTKKWHEIIDKMIWSFEEISLEYPNDPMMKTISEYHERYPQLPGESFEDFFNSKTNRPDIWEVYNYEEVKKKKEEYEDRKYEGLRLFAKWFENLWD